MLFVSNDEINWVDDPKHDMFAGLNDKLPKNKSADIIFAKIMPGHTLPTHWHSRPLDIDGTDTGYESFFFYQGGHILLIQNSEPKEYNTTEPFTLTFFSGINDKHGIKNLGNNPVVFQVLCAPAFDENEEQFCKE